jgi:sugar lactone lactonase YvrE
MSSSGRLKINVPLVLISLCFAGLAAASNREYIVSTLAGGVPPVTPVAAPAASIGDILGMAVDSAGNVYLSSELGCVFKIDSAGILTRFAGTCRPGYSGDGGLAVHAQLTRPGGMTVDAKGNLYIADSRHYVVRKVAPDATITTVAGNGWMGSSGDGGPATKAQLNIPGAVATDRAGNLYIAEFGAVRRVSRDGIITTVVGNGAPGLAPDGRTAIKAQLVNPTDLATDARGDLYFSDAFHHQVLRIAASGEIGIVAGTGKAGYAGDGGLASGAPLSNPQGIALDREGNLYIADAGNSRIRKISASGTIGTIAGNGNPGPLGDGGPAANSSVTPRLVAVDARGNVYVVGDAQDRRARLRKISTDGRISTVARNAAPESQLDSPTDITTDSVGNVYVVEPYKGRVRKIDAGGRITTAAGGETCCGLGDGGPANRALIGNDLHVVSDTEGTLYISGLSRVRKVSPDGIITTIALPLSEGAARDGGSAIGGMALDSSGTLYVADRLSPTVHKMARDGTIGGVPVQAPLTSTQKAVVDSEGNLYFVVGSELLKVWRGGTVSSVASVPSPFAASVAIDASDTLYFVNGPFVTRLTPEGNQEVIAGKSEPGYSGDGGPAVNAQFSSIGGIAIDRSGKIYLSDTAANAVRVLTPVPTAEEDTRDLKVELRSQTGSNRFQIGAEIPLEVALSSSTPNRYLEPCWLFIESDFAIPQCRFFNHWSFSIKPPTGWVDLSREFPTGPRGGSHMWVNVPDADLSSKPVTYSYVLTHRFRFDAPGEYRVSFAMEVGFDDETTRGKSAESAVRPHRVSVAREILLEVVPPDADWKAEIVRKGVQAFSTQVAFSNPPSAESRENQEARNALCNLGTAEAARALAGLLVRNSVNQQAEENCLEHTASRAAAIEEMERFLTDPDTAINPDFFRTLITLLSLDEAKAAGFRQLSQAAVDREREKLIAALPQKHVAAEIPSLLTVLAFPAKTKGNAFEFGYNLPFPEPVIARTVAEFAGLWPNSQESLVDEGWDTVRSPLMLPIVRALAMRGSGHALLRWLELDPTAATAVIRQEVVSAAPRFSSFYLRLPEDSLPEHEARIAANFIALGDAGELTRSASLLHRYATGAVLGTVLPFIDAQRAKWPCSVQVPVLAYLLKVSPADAEPRLKESLGELNQEACRTSTFFTDIGFLQPSPVLDRLALAEIDKGPKSLAVDAAAYLRGYGSRGTKPLVYERLAKWHQAYAESGAKGDDALRTLVQALADTYSRAQAWLLSPKESSELQALLGTEATGPIVCMFQGGGSLATEGAPAHYSIYGRVNERFNRRPVPMEYLNPVERLHYEINQYRCDTMKALKEKILQFPKGSTFDFAWDFTAADRDQVVEIGTFLRSHGYRVGSAHEWSFLQPDPPE